MKRQFIKPSALGVLLMFCLVFVLTGAMSGESMSTVMPTPGGEPGVTQVDSTYGVPTVLTITHRGPNDGDLRHVSTTVHWGTIAVVLAVAWCLSMPSGRCAAGYVRRDGEFAGPVHRGWRHPAWIGGYVLVGCLLVGWVCAIVLERTVGSPVSSGEMLKAFAIILMIIAVPTTVIGMIVRRWMSRSRVQQRGFAVEFASPQV